MLARKFFLSVQGRGLTVTCLSPGWVKTDMGDPLPGMGVDIGDSTRGMADVLAGERGRGRLAFLHYDGREIPW